jgi:hypothetical protein
MPSYEIERARREYPGRQPRHSGQPASYGRDRRGFGGGPWDYGWERPGFRWNRGAYGWGRPYFGWGRPDRWDERDDFYQSGAYAGRGPRGYRRADERIREDICERLTYHPEIDASEMEVTVSNSEVTLTGTVESRAMKRRTSHRCWLTYPARTPRKPRSCGCVWRGAT